MDVGKTSHNRSDVTRRYTFSATRALSFAWASPLHKTDGQLWETENLARQATRRVPITPTRALLYLRFLTTSRAGSSAEFVARTTRI